MKKINVKKRFLNSIFIHSFSLISILFSSCSGSKIKTLSSATSAEINNIPIIIMENNHSSSYYSKTETSELINGTVFFPRDEEGKITNKNGNLFFKVEMDKGYSYSLKITGSYDSMESLEQNTYKISGIKSNLKIKIEDKPELYVSKPSGFYDENIEVELFYPNCNIYYTLDGTEPSVNSTLYTAPISLSDASLNPNNYCNIQGLSVADYIDEYTKLFYSDYKTPDKLIDKCNVLRYSVFDKDNSLIKTGCNTYFVNFGNKDFYKNINVLSITSNPDNLFDDDKGIYVTGKSFNEYRNSSQYDESLSWWWMPANYHNKGKEWEREAYFDFYNEQHELVYSKFGGIRIHGGGSTALLPKSLNLYARKEYDGTKKFNYDFFGTGFTPKKLVLSSGGSSCYAKLNDYLINTLCQNLNFSTVHQKLYALFLDGEFWGYYWLNEGFDEHYLQYYYGVDSDDVAAIKCSSVDFGDEQCKNDFNDMVNYISENSMSEKSNYETACSMLDISSYIDYYATQICIARYDDWPKGNIEFWKSMKYSQSSSYYDCRWRLVLYDVNSLAMTKYNLDSIQYLKENDKLFPFLINNDSFKTALKNKIISLLNTIFSYDSISAEIDYFDNMLGSRIINEYNRFYSSENTMLSVYHKFLENTRSFFEKRNNYLLNDNEFFN